MYKLSKTFAQLLLLLMLSSTLSLSTGLPAFAADPAKDDTPAAAPKVVASVELTKLQKKLDGLKQQVSAASTDSQLSSLNDASQALSSDADALVTALQPDRAQLQAQLDVLGPPPAAGAMPENSTVAQQRTQLNARKAQLDGQLEHAKAISTSATNLSVQIVDIRRNALRTQMALNSGSILAGRFWGPLVNTQPEDARRLSSFVGQIGDTWLAAWEPEWRYGSGLLLALACAIWFFGARWLDKPMGWFSINVLPEGRLRRSFLAFSTAAVTVVTTSLGAHMIYLLFTRNPETPQLVHDFADGLLQLVFFSALIAGLGRAFLSIARPSWRLLVMSDRVAQAMRPFPPLLACCILIFGAIELLNTSVGTSVSTTIFGNGLASLLVAIVACAAPLRVSRMRRKAQSKGETPTARSTLAALIHLAIIATSFAILISLLVGYIALARFLTYELVWVGIVISCLFILIHLVVDLCDSVFSPTTAVGQRIKHALNVDDRHLAQAATLLSAIGKTVLILMGVMALLNGTFGSTTPLALINKAVDMWGGKGLEKLNIVPAHVMNAVLLLGIGMYVLRSAKRWLEKDFLPKTMMDQGLRASLVTLFSNVGYVLVILVTLSTLGIHWNNLAWIVSALSVGIGFGLQEIVKNFISGLILLTERPVKVGDLISISGIEGDIRRINVRATEIQLGDRSTVIVPNSQLISQNVRNATMGNAQGVATIALTFPLDIDPEQVRTLLLEAYRDHDAILDAPAPSVSFSQLTPSGIVLSVTGFVSSPRIVGGTKSDLLFEILKRLRAAGIALSSPQKMILENPPQATISPVDPPAAL